MSKNSQFDNSESGEPALLKWTPRPDEPPLESAPLTQGTRFRAAYPEMAAVPSPIWGTASRRWNLLQKKH